MKYSISIIFLIIAVCRVAAQKPKTQFNGYGHIEHQTDLAHEHDGLSNFLVGEQDFFVTSALNDKISFLGEYVIRYNSKSATSFLPSIERSLVKFNYYRNHNIIVGKIHTPVNYWNDVFHHGRVFFPVIERPIAFSHLIPLHTTGVQFQGQNLGNSNFGYDIVYGNGISSSEGLSGKWNPSITAAFHLKPKANFRIGASYHYTTVKDNIRGAHCGQLDPVSSGYTGSLYKGKINYHLLNASLQRYVGKLELLNEFTYNITRTDTLGAASNFSEFLYIGYRLNEKSVPFFHFDMMNIAANDLYTYPYRVSKIALGYRHEFTPFINLKLEADYQKFDRYKETISGADHSHLTFKIQLAYSF